MVPVEESPQEEDLDGDAMIKDEGSFCSNVGVSSTAVLSARNFHGFKFRLLTKSRFPRSLIPLEIEIPNLPFPFIFLLRIHQKTGRTRWIINRD